MALDPYEVMSLLSLRYASAKWRGLIGKESQLRMGRGPVDFESPMPVLPPLESLREQTNADKGFQEK
ncbi:hypothetical protein H920_00894 [Fukomys damarensis]|uniref:Uncharacterized protein n=1 Tax=Fukomys damarensis TaxID=885580 RepID=A0A091E343_FUKDA|nr:hypothetical protein H920_00894 [Fukomys damarensis]